MFVKMKQKKCFFEKNESRELHFLRNSKLIISNFSLKSNQSSCISTIITAQIHHNCYETSKQKKQRHKIASCDREGKY
jgi:hypothetical protein